ncbi:dapper homolog 3-like [Trichomycterus rosablanca]|uniref:dapper homolog 3-like n=1 Tax=Trichomycterus rosablanca TaxID=2290929 RepID=UPI002F350A27
MQRVFSVERSRYKERLEASLAALCELDLLKQRQESQVLNALRLVDCSSGCERSAWPFIRHCFPNNDNLEQEQSGAADQQDLIAVLQQQLGDLSVDAETSLTEHPTDTAGNGSGPGFCEQNESLVPLDANESRTTFPLQSPCANERSKSSGDGLQDTAGSAGRSLVPHLVSSPQPLLMGIARRGGDAESWLWQESTGAIEEGEPINEDYHQTQHVETYITGLIQRRLQTSRQCKPRTNLSPEGRGVIRQSSLCRKEPVYTSEHCKASPSPDKPIWVSCRLEEEQHSGQYTRPEEQQPGHYTRSEEQHPGHYTRPEEKHSGHYTRPEEQHSGHYTRHEEQHPSHYIRPEGQHPGQYTRPEGQHPGHYTRPEGQHPGHYTRTEEQHPGHYTRPEEQHPGHYTRPEGQHPGHYTRPEDQISTHYSRHALPGIHCAPLDFPSGDLDPSSSEADSPHHYQLQRSPSSDEQLVNAQYIPAQPTQSPMRAKTSRAHAAPKASRSGGSYSPERPQPKSKAMPKKCRFTEERTASKKPGRKACRSQSENSLLGQKGVPERKYSTVERDAGRNTQSKSRRQQGNLGHRRWRSTLELSQDEAEPPPEREVRRSRRSRPAPPAYVYNQAPQHHHHSQHHFHHSHPHSDYPLHTQGGYKHSVPVDWESSLSEGESPGTSTLSSDSDESGGLVWPQQLAPPLAPPSPPTTSGPPLQSKALVKIKASHALKKKILRFRTGSLKVMTTV